MFLTFLDLNSFSKNLKPVTSSQIYTRTNEFHQDGIFSELIFGSVGSLERKKSFSYINLNCSVVHPTAYKILINLDRKVENFLSTEKSFKLDSKGILIEDEKGVTGIREFMKMFPEINFRGETQDRIKYINLLKKSYKDGKLFIDKLPVFSPEQRPIFPDDKGRYVLDQVNNYYMTVIRKASQIKTIGKGPFYDLLNWGMQCSIIDHDEYIRTKIGKKHGLIRSNLLGKRVDFSGRAVITSGPKLKANEIGIPFGLAVSLFEPFIIHVLTHSNKIDKKILSQEIKNFTSLDLSVNSIAIVFRSIKSLDIIPENLYNIFFEATELAMENRVVIAKRDPVLHSEGVRSFYPKLITGNTIQLSTLTTGGFNADFDGDQMAIFHPITDEAQEEAKKRMMSVRSSNSVSSLTIEISKEMCVGLYELSKDIKVSKSPIKINENDIEKATDPYIPVLYKNKTTTMGKAIINNCFPKDFPFIDQLITKSIINKLIFEVVKKYGEEEGRETATKLKDVGFKFATIISPSLNLEEITIPKEIYNLKKDLDVATTEEAIKIIEDMRKIMISHLKNTGLYDLVDSGSTKGWDQPMQILVAKGIMSDPSGKILSPIKGSLSDGLTPTEYFKASSGARKGIIDRVLNTATTGYTSRKLAYLLNSVELDKNLKDCKTNLTLDLRLDKDLISRLKGRYIVKGNSIEEFDESKYKVGDLIHLRSPIFCKSLKICHTCYGRLLEIHKSPYVGIIAATTIGERGTQLIMRSFHSTEIKVIKRDIVKDISDNVPLANIKEIKDNIKQDENNLKCLNNCLLEIDLESYELGEDLIIDKEENLIYLNSLISKLSFKDVSFDLILDYPVTIKIPLSIIQTDKKIEIKYENNDEILEIPLEKQDVKELVLYIERLLAGRERFKNIDHLFLKFYKMYSGNISSMDLVHMEILLSQCLRDQNNPSIPARIGQNPEKPIMMNIKNNVFNSGFIQGLAFENVGKAINTGLISSTTLHPSILEKIVTGTLVDKKSEED